MILVTGASWTLKFDVTVEVLKLMYRRKAGPTMGKAIKTKIKSNIEALSNMTLVVEGSLLLVTCMTHLNQEVDNLEDCRDNIIIEEFALMSYRC